MLWSLLLCIIAFVRNKFVIAALLAGRQLSRAGTCYIFATNNRLNQAFRRGLRLDLERCCTWSSRNRLCTLSKLSQKERRRVVRVGSGPPKYCRKPLSQRPDGAGKYVINRLGNE